MDQEPSTKEKWRLIFKIWVINTLCGPLLFIFGFLFLDGNFKHLQEYAKTHYHYFLPLNRFFEAFNRVSISDPLQEEFYFRWPIWIIAVLIYKVGRKIEYCNLQFFLTWIPAIVLNTIWVSSHLTSGKSYYFIFPALFFTGLTWTWLTIKTRQPWPSIVAHGLANTTIYILAQLLKIIGLI
ncbi:MAG: hypothetical protein A3B99_03225 [Candidatus Yanofskybacteria bacterium RIFCSPHIGHO2_02_FULL_44_12b]|nr:MAG: hypothetical protein A2659_01800 [Candidatus Yanofskybacteria bacterium RIFCSPHIGHO2_01_FULL_44_24]OGN16298.1 MAG: hypothetical protein A3B99_03225 [Candidatus Yanofskybacteria bacterium RIFCSPHIGHO2_02_FULL_44_12b]OGN25542.1 MAG: hypothetical protein A2925_02345 [Candidatus Yanofskybacteria bacterium RIFCSPLOWO2_01_FULL_44_22]